jgi:hypothetical protein
MERIRVKRISLFLTWTLLVIAVANSILGIAFLIKNISIKPDTEGSNGIVNAIFMILQGGIFIVWGIINLNSRKYYIEWDDTEITLLLPDTKKLEKIRLSDIQSVKIKLFEVELNYCGLMRTLDLNSVSSDDLKKIKNKFENISKNLNRNRENVA